MAINFSKSILFSLKKKSILFWREMTIHSVHALTSSGHIRMAFSLCRYTILWKCATQNFIDHTQL